MKRFLLLTATLLLGYTAQAQTCCEMPAANTPAEATAQFAALGSDASFRASHLLPLPYVLENPTGAMVSFPTPDGKTAGAYYIAAPKPTTKWLLVFQEWWGLNDHIKREAEMWAKALGVNILALDMYDGKVAATREDAAKYMGGFSYDRGAAIVRGAQMFMGMNAEVGTIGWCFGGGWSLQASIILGKQAKACVIYYGMPEMNEVKLGMLEAPVLGLFASKEKWISPEVVAKYEAVMKKLGKPVEVKGYDADHAFANPSNPGFDKAATADAQRRAQAFFAKHLMR